MSKKAFILILFVVSICSYQCKSKHVLAPANELSGNIKELAVEIAKTNTLMGSAVGIAGSRPEQWDRYERMKAIATDAELVALTNDTNAVVICYAFAAVLERKHIDPFPILMEHLSDTATVSTVGGCIGGSESVRSVFFNYVNPGPEYPEFCRLNRVQKVIVDSILISWNKESE